MTGMTKKDKYIPWYFVLFFVVVAAVNAVMVTLAIRTHTGAVTDHPYEKGIAYNRVVEAEKSQQDLGWKADISIKDSILSVKLNDSKNIPLNADKIIAHITRPTQEGMDFELTLNHGQVPVSFPVKGLWEIRIFATVGVQNYQHSKRVVVE